MLNNNILNPKLSEEEQLARLKAFDSILAKMDEYKLDDLELIEMLKNTKDDELTKLLIKLDNAITDSTKDLGKDLLKDSLCKDDNGVLNQDKVAIFDNLYRITTDEDKLASIMKFISENNFGKSSITLEGNILIVKEVVTKTGRKRIVLTDRTDDVAIKAYDIEDNFKMLDSYQLNQQTRSYKKKLLLAREANIIEDNFSNNTRVSLTVSHKGFNLDVNIKSQRIEHFNDDGTLNYTEVWEPSANKKGCYEIYQEFPNGKRFLISTAEPTNNGEYLNIEKSLESSDGTKTGYVCITSTNDNGGYYNSLRHYQITDSDGNVLLQRRQQFKYQDSNNYTTQTNGQVFDVTFNGKTFNIKDNNGKVYDINLAEIVEGGSAAQKYYIPILKQLPAEDLIFIKKSGIKLKFSLTELQSPHANYENNTIRMVLGLKKEDRTFMFLHELNHLKDRLLVGKEALNDDLELRRLYNEELQLLKNNTNKANEYLLDYFVNSPADNPQRGLRELIAEAGAISNSDLISGIGFRSQTLQQHFPKTIAYLANLVSEKQMQLLE